MCICSFRFRLRSMIQKSQSRRLAASQIVGNASPSVESSLPRKRALTEKMITAREKMITAREKMITAIRLRSMFAERQRSNKKGPDSDWAVIINLVTGHAAQHGHTLNAAYCLFALASLLVSVL